MFNLKKHSQVKVYDKMLQDINKKDGNEITVGPGSYEYLLKDVRKDPSGDKNYEKLLMENHANNDVQVITDKALDNRDGKTYIPMRDEKPVPIMDYAKEFEKDEFKQYKDGQDNMKDLDTAFWDKFVGEQLVDREPIKIVGNEQSSQLLENYDSREDFRKATPSMKKSAELLNTIKDADALLYHIYRLATMESRETTEQEKQIINDVNSAKVRLLIVATKDVAAEDEYRADKADIEGDRLEQERKDKEEIESGDFEIASNCRKCGIELEKDQGSLCPKCEL